MNSKKLERIIILILLLLNVSLLLVVLTDGAQERRSDRDTADSIAALLRGNGIEVSPGADLLQSAPRECSVVRDLDAERERMRALLGAVSAEDQGGSIYYYRAADGQAVMRGTGEFDMLFTAGAVRARGDAKKAAQRLFARADIALDEASMRLSDDGETLLACCAWNGYAVWNAALEISFSGESFYTVFGTLVFDRETAEGEAGMDSLSALLRFLELVGSEGIICSRLESLTPGYLMHVSVSGESTLTPVWRIATDTGEHYLNARTGQTETLGA